MADTSTADVRVLLVAPNPEQAYGASQSTRLLMRGLPKRGMALHTLLVTPGALTPSDSDAPVSVALPDGRRWFRRPTAVGRIAGLCGEAAALMRAVRRAIRAHRADVVYVSTVEFVSPMVAARLARTPCVAHMRETVRYLEPRGRLARLQVHARTRLPDHFICVSRATAGLLHEAGVAAEKTVAIPNAAAQDKTRCLDDARRAGRRHAGIDASTPVILYAGRLNQVKGLDVLLRAVQALLARHPALGLFVVGGPTDGRHFDRHFRPLLDALPDSVQVRLPGYVQDMTPWYAAADVVAVPSREEPFGRVAVEAHLHHRAVVASRVGGLSEIVRDGVDGRLVPQGDVAALADALHDVLANPSLASQWGHAGAERAARDFAPEQHLTRVIEVLSRAARDPQAAEAGA